MLVGATAYRMLTAGRRTPSSEDDVVLVWGGAGGLGSMAIQIAKALGGIPIAVVSSDDEGRVLQEARRRRAASTARTSTTGAACRDWTRRRRVRRVDQGRARLRQGVLGRRSASAATRASSSSTPARTPIPTSIFVCDTGGMVVICAGTTGYNADVDLRYLWMRQKRLQGSHFANDEQAHALQRAGRRRQDRPVPRRAPSRSTSIGECHQLMYESKHPDGNMADPRRRPARGDDGRPISRGTASRRRGAARKWTPETEQSIRDFIQRRYATYRAGDLEARWTLWAPTGLSSDRHRSDPYRTSARRSALRFNEVSLSRTSSDVASCERRSISGEDGVAWISRRGDDPAAGRRRDRSYPFRIRRRIRAPRWDAWRAVQHQSRRSAPTQPDVGLPRPATRSSRRATRAPRPARAGSARRSRSR